MAFSSLLLAFFTRAYDPMDMFAPKGMENIDTSNLETPSADKVLKLLLHHLTLRDREGTTHPPTRFNDFDELSQLDCNNRLEKLLGLTKRTHERLEKIHTNFTDFAGLYTLLYEYPEENSYLWVIAGHLRQIFDTVNGHLADSTLWTLDRKECMPPSIRNTLLEMVTRWKKMHADGVALLWNSAGFGVLGDVHTTSFVKTQTNRNEDMTFAYMWSDAMAKVFEIHYQQMYNAMVDLTPEVMSTNARLYADEEFGMFEKTEIWRRDVFQQWALDKGLLRGILGASVRWPGALEGSPVTLGDFGGGSGHYAKWLNDTGLMHAWAYDGARGVEEITHNTVQYTNLCEPVDVQRRFDWVLCLEVAEHIPPRFTRQLLENIARHTKSVLVISWSDDDEGIGHINVRTLEAMYAEVESVTGFKIDWSLTEDLRRASAIDYISKSVTAFRRVQR
jgi:2-polyprenyl-3-methyl-5-hydroxy-6-metoxy-1,4-benzoquinol methylase